MDGWTLFLAAVAAVSGVALLAWEWIDRPRLSWAIRERRPLATHDGSPARLAKVALEIFADGSGVAHGVHVAAVGCSAEPPGALDQWDDDLSAMQMTSSSPPIHVMVSLPDDDGPVALEIHWTKMRPHRAMGFRVDLAGYQTFNWRWHWTSLRWRERRLVRLRGRWVPSKSHLRHSIPKTDRASLRGGGPTD